MKPAIAAAAALLAVLSGPAHAQYYGNPYGTTEDSPHIYSPNGVYLGDVNTNRFDPNSIANPFGPHGSEFAPDSINNRYTYGSPYGYTEPD